MGGFSCFGWFLVAFVGFEVVFFGGGLFWLFGQFWCLGDLGCLCDFG